MLYLLLYRLGWADPGRGLAWWAAAGYPDIDPTLRLVKKVWVNDGRAGHLRAWLDTQPRPFLQEFVDRCGYRPAESTSESETERGGFEERELAHDPLGPVHLHLEPAGHHLLGPFDGDGRTGVLLAASERDRRAVLITDSMLGWYGALIAHGAGLPDVGNRSWHIDVVATPVGHLGRYRRSRVTGIWFAGRHSVHTAGV